MNYIQTPLNRHKMEISSLSINKEDLKKLCLKLQERANSASDIEINNYVQGNMDNETFEKNKKRILELFQLSVTITGKNNEEISGSVEEIFSSSNFPNEVKYLFIDTKIKFKVENYYPLNEFRIFLDFTKPKLLDFSFGPSNQTPNESNFEVCGYDITWVNGVFNEMKSFFEERKSSVSFFHKHSIYDILLYLIGLPLGFWVCYKLSFSIDNLFENNFMTNMTYLYIMIFSLLVFRLLFHYIRWVSPLVDYEHEKSNTKLHIFVISTVTLSLLATFISDIFKALFLSS